MFIVKGKDRGKSGKVIGVLSKNSRVVVEGLNLIKKHQRAKRQEQKGQIISKERAVDISNVQLVCPKCGKPTRVSHKVEGGLKTRICKKCRGDV